MSSDTSFSDEFVETTKTIDVDKEISLEDIKQTLKTNNACYVLITCTEACKEGKMQVEMSYDGEESLACYLLESAQSMFESQNSDLCL